MRKVFTLLCLLIISSCQGRTMFGIFEPESLTCEELNEQLNTLYDMSIDAPESYRSHAREHIPTYENIFRNKGCTNTYLKQNASGFNKKDPKSIYNYVICARIVRNADITNII